MWDQHQSKAIIALIKINEQFKNKDRLWDNISRFEVLLCKPFKPFIALLFLSRWEAYLTTDADSELLSVECCPPHSLWLRIPDFMREIVLKPSLVLNVYSVLCLDVVMAYLDIRQTRAKFGLFLVHTSKWCPFWCRSSRCGQQLLTVTKN